MPQLVHLSLRSYYHPMQSVIPAEEKEVTYTEFLPCEALRPPFCYCRPNGIGIDIVTYSAPE